MATIDEYMADFPPEVQEILQNIRQIVQEEAPDAKEKISYGMPTFHLKKNLVHFAAFKEHIGFYPTPAGLEPFMEELKPYKQGKGSVQFPLSEPIPYDLIRRLVRSRVQEFAAKDD